MRPILLSLALLALCVCVLTVFTNAVCRPHIEETLTKSSQTALNEAGLTNIQANFDRLDATLTGTVASENERERAYEVVSGINGVRLRDSNPLAIVSAGETEPPEAGVEKTPPSVSVQGVTPEPAENLQFEETASTTPDPQSLIVEFAGDTTIPTITEAHEPVLPEAGKSPAIELAPEVEAELTSTFEESAIYFPSGGRDLSADHIEKIKLTANALSNTPNIKLFVGGYADSSGNAEANRTLSLARATAVKNQLVAFGVPEENLIVESFGAEETSAADAWKSRRVELSIKK